ncbi:hypothetical protein PAMP_006171 [Pampus punctatissimus]
MMLKRLNKKRGDKERREKMRVGETEGEMKKWRKEDSGRSGERRGGKRKNEGEVRRKESRDGQRSSETTGTAAALGPALPLHLITVVEYL